jgi:hypothetical protein
LHAYQDISLGPQLATNSGFYRIEAVEQKKSVLLVGIDPVVIDFSSADFAPQNLTADQVMSALLADQERLRDLGYESDLCLTDLGKTAERVVEEKLRAKAYDCVLIGAGIRIIPSSFLLFEKLINVVHANAPQAKLCFNTKPSDTAEAVMRWV